jgi:hypothetical protein
VADTTSRNGRTTGRDRARAEHRTAAAAEDQATPAVCPVAFCPICTAVSVANRAGPDVVEHLLVAGQQFLLALRAVVDARGGDFDASTDDEPSIERIEIR